MRLGDGEETELVQVDAIAGAVLTLKEPLAKAHKAGESACAQVGYDLGDVTDGGVTMNAASQTTDVLSAMRRLVYQTLNGYTDLSAEFSLPGLTLENLAVAAGMPYSAIYGAGTAAAPYALATDGSDFGAESNQSLIVLGVNYGGETIRVELWGCDFDYTGVSVQLRRGQLAAVKCKAVAAGGGAASSNAFVYVADVTKRSGKGKVFDALTDMGVFGTAAVPATAVAGAGAVAGSLDLGAGAFTAGDWLMVANGGEVEFHQSTGGSAISTKLLRDNVGAEVSRVDKYEFAGVTEDGVTFALGGTVTPIRLAKLRTSAGLQLGAASASLALKVADLSPENFARALGAPLTDVVGGRLHLGDNIGTAQVEGCYIAGVLKDGTVAEIIAWGCAQDTANVAVQLSQQGVAALPITLKPTSGIQFRQYAAAA